MNKIVYVIVAVLFLGGCTKENFIDTGRASGIFDGNMMEYMRSHPDDWALTVEVIEYTGLTDLFEGKDPEYPQVTFIGPTHLSILRYMLDKGIKKVADRPVSEWKGFMLNHVIKGKYMRNDITRGTSTKGGDELTAASGTWIRLYTKADSYGGVEDVGAVRIYVEYTFNPVFTIASGDIEPNNGVVHSLAYTYTFGKY